MMAETHFYVIDTYYRISQNLISNTYQRYQMMYRSEKLVKLLKSAKMLNMSHPGLSKCETFSL